MDDESKATIIHLTPDELADAKSIAAQRNKKEAAMGAMDYISTSSSLDKHEMGAIAEKAAAKFFGQDIDRRIFDAKGDDGIDIPAVPGWGNIGVKCTQYFGNPWLRVEEHHCPDVVDVWLCCGWDKDNPDQVILAGWATREEVKNRVPVRLVKGKHRNYRVYPYQLHSMSEKPNEG